MIKYKQKYSISPNTNSYSENDIRNEILEDVEILKTLGVEGVDKNKYTINLTEKRKSIYGSCKKLETNSYEITINKIYLRVAKPEDVHNTIMHEVIHSVKGCMNHKAPWKSVAKSVNDNYTFTKIQRCGNSEEYEKVEKRDPKYRHKLTCAHCNKEWLYQRKVKTITLCITGKARCPYCKYDEFIYTQI